MPTEAPPRAWEPAGPHDPHPDVKVAGVPVERERLDVRLGAAQGPGKVFLAGAVTALIAVVGVSVFTLLSGGSAEEDTPLSQSVIEPTRQAAVDTPPTEDPAPPQLSAEERRKELKKRASEAARKDKVPSPSLKKGPTPEPSEPAGPATEGEGPPVSPGTAQAVAKGMLPKYGWKAKEQFGCLYELWNRESGWRTTAGRVDGPYGIPQANPGSKMAGEGPKWRTDAATQIRWGLNYIKGRYSSPCGAWSHFQANHWY